MKDQRVDRKSLELLLQEILFLQYRWEFMRRTAMLKSDSDEYLEECMDSVSSNFDRLMDSVVSVPALGVFRREAKKKNWWEVG